MFAKLKDNQLEFAPYEKDGVINYNTESNKEALHKDGYKIYVTSTPSEDFKRPIQYYTEDSENIYQMWCDKPFTHDEVEAIRCQLYITSVDPITSHINRLRDEEQTDEIITEIEALKIKRAEVVAKIKEENPYPTELI